MANIKSAIKRHRQSIARRTRNRFHKSTMRSQIKSLLKAIEAGDQEAASQALNATLSKIDKTGKRGTIHKNTANRLKSRLTTRYNRAFA